MSNKNIVEGATTVQTVNVSEFSKITIISTGGAGDTLITGGLSTARLTSLGIDITAGVGLVTVTHALNVLRVTPGASATIDIIGDTKA